MKRARRLVPALALVGALALAAALAGCGATRTDKAGGAQGPVTLSLGTPNGPDRPESDELAYFAARVAKLSHGTVRMRIVWEAAGGPEQPVAGMVRRGRLDAALVATRAWDSDGVTSLKALQTPFLIDGQALENAVATGPLAAPMLAGLRRAGVVGLALLPAGLLHPFGFGRALRAPRDFAGAQIRVPVSTTSYGLVRALGGRPVSPDGDAFNIGVRTGAIAGAEWYLELGASLPVGDGPTTATANVVFYPKVHSLVVNAAAFARLSADQRVGLRRAAAEALRYTIRTNVAEAAAAAQFCRNGGAVVASSPAQLDALRRAAAPVAAGLARDPLTRRLIAGIRRLKAQTPAPRALRLCRPAPAAPAQASRNGPRIPDGTYRKEVSQQELIDAGVSRTDAYTNYGIQTLTISGRRWRQRTFSSAKLPAGVVPYCSGPISYAGRRVMFVADCPGGGSTTTLVLDASWTLRDGELRFLGLKNAFDRAFWGGRPWTKIG